MSTTVQAVRDFLIEDWEDAEAVFEAFRAQHELTDVRMMSDADFEAWKAEYQRLYYALHAAQLAAYGAMRTAQP